MANPSAFSVVTPSDVLRTGGAVYLLTRKSKLAKFFGYLWLAGEIYTLAKKEGAIHPGPDNTGAALSTDTNPNALLPAYTGATSARVPSQAGDGLAVPAFAGLLGFAGV